MGMMAQNFSSYSPNYLLMGRKGFKNNFSTKKKGKSPLYTVLSVYKLVATVTWTEAVQKQRKNIWIANRKGTLGVYSYSYLLIHLVGFLQSFSWCFTTAWYKHSTPAKLMKLACVMFYLLLLKTGCFKVTENLCFLWYISTQTKGIHHSLNLVIKIISN